MTDRGYEHRKEWNAKNYKQLNVALPPNLAEAFKAACASRGETARQVVVRLISDFTEEPIKPRGTDAEPYGTRGKRRKAAGLLLEQLKAICDAEEAYRENIPENLQGSVRYANAEKAVGLLADAIEAMEDAFINE